MRTKSVQTFKIEPDHVGGKKKSVQIRTTKVATPTKDGRKTAPPESYLLIGFDTEYQTFDAVDVRKLRNEEIEARNEILSYQFCVKAVYQDGTSSREVSGIIVPEQADRIRIEDFIAFAIGSWSELHRNAIIPCDAYLIGHFTRADLPAFREFQNNARQVSNVRNTFVSVNSSVKLRVEESDDPDTSAVFKLRLRDTFLLAPANAKSLSDIGKIVGTEKVALHSDPFKEIAIKENMKQFLQGNWRKFRHYAIRDGEVCVRYAERLIRQHNTLFQKFSLPVTLTSFGTTLVLGRWETDGLDVNEILGKEEIEEKKFSKKLGFYAKKKETVYIEEVHWKEAFVTESYHGGRNEQFFFGIADEGDWRDLDLSSAYTTAMSIIGYPNWTKIKTVKTLKQLKFDNLAYCSIDFEFPKNVRFPVLPVRTQNGIIFPRKGKTVCAAPELLVAKELGAKIRIKEGCMVVTDRTKPVFKTFIQDCITQRNKHDKTSFDNLFWKEVGNSTYGKTAQGLRQKRVYDLRGDDMVELPPSRLTQPFFASFITSYVRAVLGEILNALPTSVQVFSVTTDGFLSTASEAEIDKVMNKPLARSFEKARRDLVGDLVDNRALDEKHRIRQPIGWRTRGSATLIAGEQDENNIVLQKGGIKTDEVDRKSVV